MNNEHWGPWLGWRVIWRKRDTFCVNLIEATRIVSSNPQGMWKGWRIIHTDIFDILKYSNRKKDRNEKNVRLCNKNQNVQEQYWKWRGWRIMRNSDNGERNYYQIAKYINSFQIIEKKRKEFQSWWIQYSMGESERTLILMIFYSFRVKWSESGKKQSASECMMQDFEKSSKTSTTKERGRTWKDITHEEYDETEGE